MTSLFWLAKALHNIVTAELSLFKELQVGMETYIQPLKHMLTTESHRKMFQGIPEVKLSLSLFIIQLAMYYSGA